MGTCPTTGGKPSPSKGSCASCVSWGEAVKAEIYPPGGQIQWSNVNSTMFSANPFEVAKAFVHQMKPGKTYSTFGDFDSASLLMIMMGIKEFHQSDQASYTIIKKVRRKCAGKTVTTENMIADFVVYTVSLFTILSNNINNMYIRETMQYSNGILKV